MEWSALLADYTYVLSVVVVVVVVVVVLDGCPASPFIAARGGWAFTCVSL